MTICIVDDDAFVRTSTIDLLNSLGHEAVAFETAEAFLDSGHIKGTLCLILDQHLPGLSGLDLQNHLLVGDFQGAIIFITAFPDSKNRERALNAGAVAFLTKPYDAEDLILALQAAMSNSS